MISKYPTKHILHWYVFKKELNPKKKSSSFWYFFPDYYEYVNHFFQAHPDVPKFHDKGLKIA